MAPLELESQRMPNEAARATPGGHTRSSDCVAFGLLLFCLAAYVVHAVYATTTHRHLYGDAAWFLVRIISEGRVTNFYSDFLTEFYYSRFVSYALTQLPTVLAARLGLGDWQLLSWVMGATYFVHKPLSLLACYWLLPRGSKLAIVFPALAIFAGTINSEIYIVTETHIAISLFWPLLIAVSLWPQPGRRFFVACSASCVVLAFSYESMAFLGPMLWVVVLVRWLIADKQQHAGWAWLLLAALMPIIISWMAILFPRDPTNKAAFADGLLLLWKHSTSALETMHAGPVASVLALGALAVLFLLPAGTRLRVPGMSVLVVVAVVLAVFPLLHFLRFSEHVDFSHSITDRGFGGLAIQVLLVPVFLLSVITDFARLRGHALGVALVVSALVTGQVTWQLLATRSWHHALGSVSSVLEAERGRVECSPLSLPRSEHEGGLAPAPRILCHWWVMPLSVLLAPEGKVTAMLLSTQSFRPFDPLKADSLPSMQFAPVDYGPFLAEGVREKSVHSGETVSFATGGRGVLLLGKGFSHSEPWATWTDADEAQLEFCVAARGRHQATFVLVPFVNETRPTLDAEVHVNGLPAARWRFVAGEQQVERSVAVGGDEHGAAGGCTQIVIKFSGDPVPDLPAQGDPRRLGLAFISLSIREVAD